MRIRRLLATSFVGFLIALAAYSGGSPLESTATGPSMPGVGNAELVAFSNSGSSNSKVNPQSILELLTSVNNPVNKTIIGTISHFSRYTVAY